MNARRTKMASQGLRSLFPIQDISAIENKEVLAIEYKKTEEVQEERPPSPSPPPPPPFEPVNVEEPPVQPPTDLLNLEDPSAAAAELKEKNALALAIVPVGNIGDRLGSNNLGFAGSVNSGPGQLVKGTYIPHIDTAMERLEALVSFVNQEICIYVVLELLEEILDLVVISMLKSIRTRYLNGLLPTFHCQTIFGGSLGYISYHVSLVKFSTEMMGPQ